MKNRFECFQCSRIFPCIAQVHILQQTCFVSFDHTRRALRILIHSHSQALPKCFLRLVLFLFSLFLLSSLFPRLFFFLVPLLFRFSLLCPSASSFARYFCRLHQFSPNFAFCPFVFGYIWLHLASLG